MPRQSSTRLLSVGTRLLAVGTRLLGLGLMACSIASVLLLLSAMTADASCRKRVVLYNASWCTYCRQVRAILARNNIRYTMLDATTARVQADMVKRFGDASVPRTVIGGAVVHGVDEARIKRLCR